MRLRTVIPMAIVVASLVCWPLLHRGAHAQLTPPAGGGSAACSGTALGCAVFSASGGTVGNLHVGGVVSGITRVGTGHFTVSFGSAQSNYTASMTVTDNNTAAGYSYVSGNSYATIQTNATSFDIYTMSCPSGTCNALFDPAVVTVTVNKLPGG